VSEAVDRVVIAGGGVAAQRCAFALRELGYERAVTVLSAEREAPYDRTLLSKRMIEQRSTEVAPLRPRGSYEDAGIDLRLGTAAAALDARGAAVVCADGTRVPYDRLVVATGGEPLLPRALAAAGVQTLREADDVERLLASLAGAERLAVVGGGFIGGELASAVRRLGLEVTLVEAAAAPLAPLLGAEVGEQLAALHAAHGVQLRLGAAARGVERSGRGWRIALDDGDAVEADVVVAAVGMRPRVDWLRGSGLELTHGVETDAHCRTRLPGVLAAGDCARWHSPRHGTAMRAEHWDVAARHGVAAAAAALGEVDAFDPVPFFWSDQHGVKLAMAGTPAGWDDVRVERDDGGVTASYYRAGALSAVFSTADVRRVVAARRELATAPANERS
jgi:NADPH-dependent 2,4-dienoyl-CoA reductase/sulfur reductase-like enzyme